MKGSDRRPDALPVEELLASTKGCPVKGSDDRPRTPSIRRTRLNEGLPGEGQRLDLAQCLHVLHAASTKGCPVKGSDPGSVVGQAADDGPQRRAAR